MPLPPKRKGRFVQSFDTPALIVYPRGMAKKAVATTPLKTPTPVVPQQKPSALLDTRVIYCGDNLEQLAKLPDALREIEAFFKRSHKFIVALTVKEILDEQIAKKLA